MFKKLLSAIAVATLAISSLCGTAFAANEPQAGDVISVSNIDELQAGTYELDADLSCYITAMGGVEFGAPLLTGTQLVVADDGTASMTLSFTTSSVTIYGITVDTYVGEARYYSNQKLAATIGILEGTAWKAGTYTLSDTVTAVPSYASVSGEATVSIIDSITVPVAAVEDTYKLALCVDSSFMGMQFGADSKYDATLTVDWANTVVKELAVTYDDTLTTNKYAVDISWSPMAAMFSPVLDIDVDADTFNIYNASVPATSKGSGAVTFDETTGVYTLTYEAGVATANIGATTTFTYDAATETITFTSKLLYGSASFNNVDDAGNFVTYTAVVYVEETTEATTEETTEATTEETTEATTEETTEAATTEATTEAATTEATTEAEVTTEATTAETTTEASGEETTEAETEATTEAATTEASGETTAASVVETGDTSNAAVLLVVCLAAAVVAVGTIATKKKLA